MAEVGGYRYTTTLESETRSTLTNYKRLRGYPENASCVRLAELLDRQYLELKEFAAAERVRIEREEARLAKLKKVDSTAVIAAARAFRKTKPSRPALQAETTGD